MKQIKFLLGLVMMVGLIWTFQITSYASSEKTGEESQQSDLNDISVTMSGSGSDVRLEVEGISNGDSASTWTTIYTKFKGLILGVSGLATLVFVGLFIYNFIVLGASANNPAARSNALTGCLWTAIASACCGAVLIIVGLTWNAFK